MNTTDNRSHNLREYTSMNIKKSKEKRLERTQQLLITADTAPGINEYLTGFKRISLKLFVESK